MVDVDSQGRVCAIVVKPRATDLRVAWAIAVWTSRFTAFLHDFVRSGQHASATRGQASELYLGDVVQAAIDAGHSVEAVEFPEGGFSDLGTPDELAATVLAAAMGSSASAELGTA
jgi:glucose-1-phosphate thymidylyltransferase